MGDSYANNGGKSSPHGTRGDTTHNRDQAYSKTAAIDRPSSNTKEKTLLLIPQRFTIAMLDHGWILRNDLIWHKPNCMPSSATDRFTVDYEHIFFFTKSQKYYFKTQYEPYIDGNNSNNRVFGGSKYGGTTMRNKEPIKEGESYSAIYSGKKWEPNDNGRIKRSVWRITTQPYQEAHFAVFPEQLIETPIIAGCPEGGIVLDPFAGSGTTLKAAHQLRRKWIGIEINPVYVSLIKKRLTPYVQQQRLTSFPLENVPSY